MREIESKIESVKQEPESWQDFVAEATGGSNRFSVAFSGNVARVSITGEVGIGWRADDLIKQTKHAEAIELFIDTPGGCTVAAMNVCHAWRGRVTTATVTGRCYSAGIPFLMTAKHIRVERRARLMIHAPKTFSFDSALGILVRGQLLHDYSNELSRLICERTELSQLVVEGWLSGEQDFYFDAEAAIQHGLADEIIDAPKPSPSAALPSIPLAPKVVAIQQAQTYTESQQFLLDLIEANTKANGAIQSRDKMNHDAFMRELFFTINRNSKIENL